MELLLSGVHPRPPLECHNPRVPKRTAMDAIFVVHPGTQWQMPQATGICLSSLICHRFCELTDACVFEGL